MRPSPSPTSITVTRSPTATMSVPFRSRLRSPFGVQRSVASDSSSATSKNLPKALTTVPVSNCWFPNHPPKYRARVPMLLNYHHECNDHAGSLDWIGRHEHYFNINGFRPDHFASPSGTRYMTVDGRAIAAIDIGSNTLKLTVARVSHGQITLIAGTAEVVRLCEGLGETGRLRDDRIQLAIDVLRGLKEIARELSAGTIIAVATAATRSAANGMDFLARVKDDVGLDVSVIDGDEEARLTSNGVLAQIDPGGAILIVDIGGASTELIATRDGVVLESTSLDLGS